MFGTSTGNRDPGECHQCKGSGHIYKRTSFYDERGDELRGMGSTEECIKCAACGGFGDAGTARAWHRFKYGQGQRT